MRTQGQDDQNRREEEVKAVLSELLGGIQSDLGHALERKELPEKALPLFQAEVARQPDDARAWYNLGDTLLSLKRNEEARQALEKALDLAPGAWIAAYDLGLAYSRLGLPEKAVEIFAAFTKVDPELRRAPSHLGLSALTNQALCYGDLGFWEQAKATLKPALRLVTGVLYNLGRFAYREGAYEESKQYFLAAVEAGHSSEDVLHGAGAALMKLKKWREAEGYLARAVKASPGCRDAWYDRGVCFAKQRIPKLRAAARRCFSTVLKLDPKYAWAEYDLACLDALAGKSSLAFRHLNRALEFGLDDAGLALRDPDLKSLKRDSRWRAFSDRVKAL